MLKQRIRDLKQIHSVLVSASFGFGLVTFFTDVQLYTHNFSCLTKVIIKQ